ncbi:SRPBCC family protein [Emticicia sp. 21SJ11W-3]|uniref:SRPBCC family protein n=1 Tax=Emticicia sp. 21SJ11W-3 TaxID=2916755 RepID=UPI00209FEDB2|nr:SRPBCC family protein [Emticicia sp. 21SJ11W-3]UTA68309.1 SRPBCC family protein [Emticicia sp. 21SJ11W-3]
MSKIILETLIHSTPEICYDLSLSVDLHQLSTAQTKEYIVDGVRAGIMKLGESVTWRAKHFGIWLELSTKITEAHRPEYFVDEMQKGPFKSLRHEHHFTKTDNGVLMKDIFMFKSPMGFLGKIANTLVLENYLKSFLAKRNQCIKEMAESGRWKEILGS